MRKFKLNILTNRQLEQIKNDEFIDGFTSCAKQSDEMIYNVLSELERLKKDHWDKYAFDRIRVKMSMFIYNRR